jgi:hypothetical protein
VTNVKILKDSISVTGRRLTTFELEYQRFIHAELLTHRILSRNSSSSRAKPVKKVIQDIQNNIALPCHWGQNCKGMQAKEELRGWKLWFAKLIWKISCKFNILCAKVLLKLNVHKQIANRLLEPYSHIKVIVTATEYANFFNLRVHPDAQPEMQLLAYKMLEAYKQSSPEFLEYGTWHLPFADKFLDPELSLENKLKIVTARSARISYATHHNKISEADDYRLHDDLMQSGHWSPFEHAAVCMADNEWYGNLRGFKSYRKFFKAENRGVLDIESLLSQRVPK